MGYNSSNGLWIESEFDRQLRQQYCLGIVRQTQIWQNGLNTGVFRDDEGFDEDGLDKNGFDREGFDRYGFDKNGFDRDGFDRDGLNITGYNRDGVWVRVVDYDE